MGGGVSRLADKVHAPEQVVIHDTAEVLCIHQADQGILIGHGEGAVHGIHPFDGALHGPAAIHGAGPRIDPVNALRRHGSLRKGREVLFFCEEVKIRHGKFLPMGKSGKILLHKLGLHGLQGVYALLHGKFRFVGEG